MSLWIVQLINSMYFFPDTDTSRISFYCRLQEKPVSRNDHQRYEIIHVVGMLKPIPGKESSKKQKSKRAASPLAGEFRLEN